MKEVPVIVQDDMSEEDVKGYRIADNKTSEQSEWNFTNFADTIIELENANFEIKALGMPLEEIEDIVCWTEADRKKEKEIIPKQSKEIECPYCHKMFKEKSHPLH